MSQYLSLSPVSVAVYTALNVAALTSLATGGVHDDLPQNLSFPMVLFEVAETQQLGGFGTRVGLGQLPEVEIRLTVYTKTVGMKTAQAVMAKALELLATAPATVTGYSSWAIFWDSTIPIPESMIAGEKVQELVSTGRLYVEEAA